MQDKVIPSLSAAIAKEVERRTQGVDWCETEIAGLDFYRQSAPTSC